MLASLLLDVDLNEQALEASERGLAVSDSARLTFWRVRGEATHAIARMRLGDLEVGAALNGTLRHARKYDERTQMVRCLEGLAELTLRRGEVDVCSAIAEEMLALAKGAAMRELAARGHYWRGEALAARGNRDSGVEQLALAAAAADKIGRVRLAKDAHEALARVGGDPAQRARALALAARIAASARECERLLATE